MQVRAWAGAVAGHWFNPLHLVLLVAVPDDGQCLPELLGLLPVLARPVARSLCGGLAIGRAWSRPLHRVELVAPPFGRRRLPELRGLLPVVARAGGSQPVRWLGNRPGVVEPLNPSGFGEYSPFWFVPTNGRPEFVPTCHHQWWRQKSLCMTMGYGAFWVVSPLSPPVSAVTRKRGVKVGRCMALVPLIGQRRYLADITPAALAGTRGPPQWVGAIVAPDILRSGGDRGAWQRRPPAGDHDPGLWLVPCVHWGL